MKINDQNVYLNSKNPIFGPFPQFMRQKKLQKIWLLHAQLGQTAGPKDRKTLFCRTLPSTARGPTSSTALDWHLKSKDTEYNIHLIKNYCIKVSMQKICSIHKLILKACVCYFLSNFYFSPYDSPSKTIKNVFYFT